MAATNTIPSASPAFSHRVVIALSAPQTFVPASTAGASQFGSTGSSGGTVDKKGRDKRSDARDNKLSRRRHPS